MKHSINICIGSLLLLVMLSACEKTIILDTTQAPPKIVIEALLTDQLNYQYVKVSRSGGFYESGKTARVTDAVITITDNLSNAVIFTHNPEADPALNGYYVPPMDYRGEVGRTYYLSVIVDGVTYSAEETLLPVAPLDSLNYQVNEDQFEDPETPGKFIELMIFAKEPQETKDYYLFKFYRNDSLTLFSPTDIYYADDLALGEEIAGVQSPIYYEEGDTARVEMYSLTRRGFVYYNDLFNSLNNDGGIYGPPPSNNRTNLSNGALGFFQVSSVSVKGIKIE